MSLQSQIASLITAIGADIKALNTSAAKIPITFFQMGINQAASATTALNFMLPTTTTAFSIAIASTTEIKMLSAGKVIAAGISMSGAISSGTLNVQMRKNGGGATTVLTLTSASGQNVANKITPFTFAANDTVGIALNSVSLSPTTIDSIAFFTVLLD